MLPKPLKMKPHGLADFPLCFFPSFAGCDAARQVWHISRIVAPAFSTTTAYRITILSPSADGLPAMVTRPGLVGCLYCRWLSRVASRDQPSASIKLMTSRTFTALPVASTALLGTSPASAVAQREHRRARGRSDGAGGWNGDFPGQIKCVA